jgi:hypothetical protein
MKTRPLSYESSSGPRIDFASEQFAVKIKRGVLALVFRMKVRRIMITIKHANNYTKENTYCRHDTRILQTGLKNE